MAINWSLANGGGFENALATGMAMGEDLRKRREEKEYKNALAGYDPANPDTLKPVMAARPEVGMQLQRQAQQDEQFKAQQAERQRAQYQDQMGTMRKLLVQAKTNPQQAFAAAQSLGIDTSKLPPPDSPEFQPWVDQQLFIADAMDKEGDKLPGIVQEVMFAVGTDDPSDPRVREGVVGVLNNKYASDYVDGQGNTRRRSTLNIPGGPSPQPYDPNEWEMVDQGGRPAQGSSPFGQ